MRNNLYSIKYLLAINVSYGILYFWDNNESFCYIILIMNSKKNTANKYLSTYTVIKMSLLTPLCSVNPSMIWHLHLLYPTPNYITIA
jgi:hypothetical protein